MLAEHSTAGRALPERLPYFIPVAVFFAVSFALLSAPSLASNASDPKLSTRLKNVIEEMRVGQCQQAWANFWRADTYNDKAALFWMAAASSFGHAFSIKTLSKTENEEIGLPMMFFGTLFEGSTNEIYEGVNVDEIRHLLANVLDAWDHKGTNHIQIKACLLSSAASQVCVDMAIRDKSIPPYNRYLEIVGAMNRRGLRVECDTSEPFAINNGRQRHE